MRRSAGSSADAGLPSEDSLRTVPMFCDPLLSFRSSVISNSRTSCFLPARSNALSTLSKDEGASKEKKDLPTIDSRGHPRVDAASLLQSKTRPAASTTKTRSGIARKKFRWWKRSGGDVTLASMKRLQCSTIKPRLGFYTPKAPRFSSGISTRNPPRFFSHRRSAVDAEALVRLLGCEHRLLGLLSDIKLSKLPVER